MPSLINSSIGFFFFFFLIPTIVASAQHADAAAAEYLPPETAKVSFGPSVAIAIAVFSVMLSFTVIFLVYVKCRRHPTPTLASELLAGGGLVRPNQRHHASSGVDESVVESLPFFRFSSLRGVREGLECAVCLSRFAGDDVLRLLPKCKHAFHIACVDRWFETNSTCPLCRCKVNAGDATQFAYSTSSRFLFASGRHESCGGDLELFIERERDDRVADAVHCQDSSSSSRRFADAIRGGIWKTLTREKAAINDDQFFHKVKHKIIVSDVVFKGRWSALSSSDLLSLDSDMLKLSSSERFAEKSSTDDDRLAEEKTLLEIKVKRSMSELTNLSRLRKGNGSMIKEKDEKMRRIWLPIARRTVRCFAGARHRELSAAQEESSNV